MDLNLYLENRRRLALQPPRRRMRTLCFTCLQPHMTCYCRHVKKFDAKIKFVILIHRLEARRRIATGRLSHLCLQNSELMMGYDYSQNQKLNEILENPNNFPVVLFPGAGSKDLSAANGAVQSSVFPQGKEPVVIVLDGTWSTAKKMLRRSRNLQSLPRICFTPNRPSNFRVRKQPKAGCFSTVEAIHQIIDLLGPSQGFDVSGGAHHNLLKVFDAMVEQQLEYVRISHAENRHSRHRRRPLEARS